MSLFATQVQLITAVSRALESSGVPIYNRSNKATAEIEHAQSQVQFDQQQ